MAKKAKKKSAKKKSAQKKKARPTRKKSQRAAKKKPAGAKARKVPYGAITHVEIPAPDLARAKGFYEKIFKWEVQIIPGMEQYALFKDGFSGGGLNSYPGAAETGIRPFITVKDIPAKLAEVVAAGGSVVQEKCEIPGGYGFVGQFTDPNGVTIGLWSAS